MDKRRRREGYCTSDGSQLRRARLTGERPRGLRASLVLPNRLATKRAGSVRTDNVGLTRGPLAVEPRRLPAPPRPSQGQSTNSFPTPTRADKVVLAYLAGDEAAVLAGCRALYVPQATSPRLPPRQLQDSRAVALNSGEAAIHLQSLGECADDRASLGARRKTCSWPISPMTAAPHRLDVPPT